MPANRGNSNRLNRVNEELKREISQIINYELNNKNVTGMIGVTKVKITPDLRYAKVYITMLDFKDANKNLEGLKKSAGFIRSRIANKVNLRITPELVFVYDDSEEQGEKIDKILRDLNSKK